MVWGFWGLGLDNNVLAEDGGLLQVLPLAVHPRRTSMVDHSGPLLSSELFCRTPPSCLKVTGGWGGVGAPFWILGVGTGKNWVGIGSGGIRDYSFHV